MEFPHIGNHCRVKTCNRLDFLPMKCDACSNLFCIDHFTYDQHSCEDGFRKDIQVPVCPLCNNPVPSSKRGEQPDIVVSQHIDRDCQADPAIENRKIYTNKCNVKGCKQKEALHVACNICRNSYCLKHRHPADHKCEKQKAVSPAQAAGAAAMARAQNTKKSKFSWFSGQSSSSGQSCSSGQSYSSGQSCSSEVERRPAPTPMPEVSIASIHGRLSEDEALALALQQSLNETEPRSVQEEEDILVAQALAIRDQRRVVRNQENRDRNCIMS